MGDAGTGGGEELARGTLVAGRYRVEQCIGRGGMGSVYRAIDESGDAVAIKVMHRFLVGEADVAARFDREARAARAIRHAHVVSVLDTGLTDAGVPYLVMEHVTGRSLAEALVQESPFEVDRACRIAAQLLDGLSALHAAGVVHRDLKPDNVLLSTGDGGELAKISDLGVVAWTPGRAPETWVELTPAGRTMGTPRYAAPEQIGGARGRDPRVDLYAVGVLFFEMLAGEAPFRADAPADLLDLIRTQSPPPVGVFRAGVPAPIEQVVRRALEKRPEDRHADALDMWRAIAAVAPGIVGPQG